MAGCARSDGEAGTFRERLEEPLLSRGKAERDRALFQDATCPRRIEQQTDSDENAGFRAQRRLNGFRAQAYREDAFGKVSAIRDAPVMPLISAERGLHLGNVGLKKRADKFKLFHTDEGLIRLQLPHLLKFDGRIETCVGDVNI